MRLMTLRCALIFNIQLVFLIFEDNEYKCLTSTILLIIIEFKINIMIVSDRNWFIGWVEFTSLWLLLFYTFINNFDFLIFFYGYKIIKYYQ